ncbi:hypothetical protein QE410_003244 [Microbacterium sp. SORGH_AS 1204]|uniref:DUF6907 domain-containing protein n=1 Tax=Microbacterium sp. SORGH_AS_1204 TaxID=3041785 RepID=UPI002792A9AE|nr:hypothetical protein [Microbacterium sp. SORGH_AS_1204]
MNTLSECPSWCDREHLTDIGADQIHEAPLESVPVVAMSRTFPRGGALLRSVEATEVVVFAYQYVGDDETWIAVVEEELQRQRIEISLESARRLQRSLTALLDRIG